VFGAEEITFPTAVEKSEIFLGHRKPAVFEAEKTKALKHEACKKPKVFCCILFRRTTYLSIAVGTSIRRDIYLLIWFYSISCHSFMPSLLTWLPFPFLLLILSAGAVTYQTRRSVKVLIFCQLCFEFLYTCSKQPLLTFKLNNCL